MPVTLRPVRIALIAGPAFTLLLAALTPGASLGLPTYSRSYGLPCRQCHGTFSGLNREGMRFLQSGHRLSDAAAPSHPSLQHLSLSVVADLDQEFADADSAIGAGAVRGRDRASETRLGSLGVHAMGTWATWAGHGSFHVEGRLPTRDGTLVANTAFAQADDLVRRGALNFKAGEYLVQGPYLALSRAARFQDYLTAESVPARGFELNGVSGTWTYGAGMLQSRRAQHTATAATPLFGRLEDPYLWLVRDLGGQRVGARMLFDRQDSNLPFHAWLQHLQAQASAVLAFRRIALVPAYTFDRFDDRPAAGLHQRRQTALLEARLPLDVAQRWQLTAFAEHDYTTQTRYSPEADRHHEALGLGYDVRPNAELAVEWLHAGDNVAGPRIDQLNTFLRIGY